MPTRVALLIEYDGSDFAGWQVQPRRRTVQGVLAGAMGVRPAAVHGAGRTDAGVHALGQVAHVDVARVEPGRWRAALPPDISILRAEIAPPGFDARRSAIRRVYRYRIRWGPRPALERDRVGWFRGDLDVEAMDRVARAFEGTRDLSAFSSTLRHGPPVRTIERCRVTPDGPHGAVLEIAAPSFLMHQVRRIVGAVVGTGATAPARGLYLVRVEYPASLDPFA